MTSQIIPTNPTAGSATTSSVRENFRIADEEITQLQRSSIDAQDLTGGPSAYLATYPSDPTFTLVDGVRVAGRVNVTNTTSFSTLSVNGTLGLLIRSVDGDNLEAGDLVAGKYYEFMVNALDPAAPYWTCLNINKGISSLSGDLAIPGDLSVAGTSSAINLQVSQGGQLSAFRAEEEVTIMNVNGSTVEFGSVSGQGGTSFKFQNSSNELFRINSSGVAKPGGGYESSDGTAGVTGTASASATLTVKNGLITAIS